MNDIAVVIPCSKRKIACTLPLATADELATAREGAHERLSCLACGARELYLGRQHRAMIAAIDSLRGARPDLRVTLHVVSAGYGLLGEHDVVVPYDAALGSRPTEWQATGRRLDLHAALCRVIGSARHTLICLSAAYLVAAGAPFDCGGTPVYIAAGSGPLGLGVARIPAGRDEARQLGVPEREVRGAVLRSVCHAIARSGPAALHVASVLPRARGRLV